MAQGYGWVTLPVSLALIQHLHLPENPTPNVARLLLNDLKRVGVGGGHSSCVSQTFHSPRGLHQKLSLCYT